MQVLHFRRSTDEQHKSLITRYYNEQTRTTVSVNPPPQKKKFWHFFPNGWEFLVQILHAYYTFVRTLEYKFLFN